MKCHLGSKSQGISKKMSFLLKLSMKVQCFPRESLIGHSWKTLDSISLENFMLSLITIKEIRVKLTKCHLGSKSQRISKKMSFLLNESIKVECFPREWLIGGSLKVLDSIYWENIELSSIILVENSFSLRFPPIWSRDDMFWNVNTNFEQAQLKQFSCNFNEILREDTLNLDLYTKKISLKSHENSGR